MNNTNSDIVGQLPITLFINQLKNQNQNLSFDNLMEELNKKDDNNNKFYNINTKEFDDLCILYNDSSDINNIDRDPNVVELEKSCRSIILDKQNLIPIGSQYSEILYNNDVIDLFKNENISWDNTTVQKCHEGTQLIVYNHKNIWHVSTRRCINSEDSTWIHNKSYREMFDEAMNNKFTLEELDKNLVYHFVLVHHKNKNIVNYSNLGEQYAELYHILTTEKYTLNEVNCKINGVISVEEEQYDDLNKLLQHINIISQENEHNHKIITEGYILRIYEKEKYKSKFKVGKLQTEIYQTLMKMKPNNSNMYQSYLELYQQNKLIEFLPYFSKFSIELTKRIHIAMSNIANEILDLYHCTRQKKNPEIYANLTEHYKKILYGLHGLYIQHRKPEFLTSDDKLKISKSINVHDVYHHLKNLPPNDLRQLFYDRTKLIEDPNNAFINKNCLSTKVQCTQMFNNLNNLNDLESVDTSSESIIDLIDSLDVLDID
jgi:hypothetical protein